jgi:aspartate oxidase
MCTLDCRHFSKEKFVEHFPNIYKKCLSIGIDITQQMIPVAPAAHYSCGGIKTDEWGRSSINNLYACGECASTVCMAPIGWQVIRCLKDWYLLIVVLLMQQKK